LASLSYVRGIGTDLIGLIKSVPAQLTALLAAADVGKDKVDA